MKKLIYILLISLSLQSFGQVTKYKDVDAMIDGTSDDYSMQVLKAFVSTNLDHPTANLRLSALYLKKAQAADPLIDYEKIQALAEQSRQKLFKATIVINDKEIKKHKSYYGWIAKLNQEAEATPALVNQYIKTQQIEVDKLQKSLPLVYTKFTQSVDSYDKAVKNFVNISSNYSSLKNLYLLHDDKLDAQLTTLKSDYDSALYYFGIYKSMTDTLALKGYKQSLTIKPITVFRYDGLVTQINFLKNEIDVWNYAAWVDSVRAVINGDILALRTLLKINEDRQNAAITKLSNSSISKEATVVPIDKSLVFNLLRFDYNNPIVPLLKYKESKQKLLIEESNSTYFDTANIAIERKLLFYNKMVYQIKKSDSLIAQFKNRFDAVRMAKYNSFLNENYNGIDGSSQYMASEKNKLRKELTIYGSLLQEGVESIKPVDSIGNILKYNRLQILLHITPQDSNLLATGVPYTTHILKSPDGGYYLTGEYKPNKKLRNTKVYLLKVTNKNRIKWFKNYDIKIDSAGADSNNKIADITLTNEGVALLIRTEHLTKPTRVSSLIQVLFDGNTKLEKRVESTLYPRSVMYNEEQNSFIICNNGSQEKIDSATKNNFELKTINSLGEISWTYTDANTGSFVGLLRTEKGYLVARNSFTIGKAKILLTNINFTGAKQQEKALSLGESKPLHRIYKLNDASIHLLGNGAYQMINANLEEIYP